MDQIICIHTHVEYNSAGEPTYIEFANIAIDIVPDFLQQYPSIQHLGFMGCNLKEIPEWISIFTELRTLSLEENNISKLPDLSSMSNLKELILKSNPLLNNIQETYLPNSITVLDLVSTGLTEVPAVIEKLLKLQWLGLSRNNISTIPNYILKLKHLETLNLANLSIKTLPKGFGQFPNLRNLNLQGSALTILPDGFGRMPKLCHLEVSCTKLKEFPESMHQFELKNLVELVMENTDIKKLPSWINPETTNVYGNTG